MIQVIAVLIFDVAVAHILSIDMQLIEVSIKYRHLFVCCTHSLIMLFVYAVMHSY